MCLTPINLKNPSWVVTDKYLVDSSFTVPCGHCEECQKDIANEWAYRCVDELKAHSENCFVTFTYEETDRSLHKKDIQDFLKRLRRRIEPITVRYFGCGEYGKRGGRPHFHLILFGWKPTDLEFFFTDKDGTVNYRSQFLYNVWRGGRDVERLRGFILVSDASFDTAKYSALYMQKFQRLSKDVEPPFRIMSRKPGIGYYNIDREQILNTDKVYYKGKYKKTPRYYLKVMEREGIDLTELKERRKITAQICAKNLDEIKHKLKNQKNFTGPLDEYDYYDI